MIRNPGSLLSPGSGWRHISTLVPAPENDLIYGAVHADDPEVLGLAESIRRHGLREKIRVSEDGFIVSGHRRRLACHLAGAEWLLVDVEPVTYGTPEFRRLLVEFNRQRDKTPGVRVQEEMVLVNPDDAYRELLHHRAERARVKTAPLVLGTRRPRHRLSKAKAPFLAAVRKVLEDLKEYLPVSDRRIHYSLLNDPPLKHASKPKSRYANDPASYKNLTALLTTARVHGLIPFEAIADETRPVDLCHGHPNVSAYVREELERFLAPGRYWRDLMQGQPHHVEVLAEKNTVRATVEAVTRLYTIPLTTGRGYSSLPPRKAMYDRYAASGKDKLIILCVSDHDPEGDDIPDSFGKSMRDDFGVRDLHTVKVALRADQAAALALPQNTEAEKKKDGSRYKKFVAKYGPAVWELEAVPPATLQRWVREAIDQHIDVDAFNAQSELDKAESATLEAKRRAAADMLLSLAAG